MLNVVKFAPQAYEKTNATPVYANAQLASKKAPLYFQYDYGSTPPAVKKVEAVKLDNAGNEVSRTILTNFISVVDNSYISDTSVSISPELDENCIYYFEFTNDKDETFRTNVFETFAPPQLIYSNGVVEDKETGEESVKGLVSVLQFKVISDRLAGVATFTVGFGDGSDPVTTQAGFQDNQSRIVSVEKVIESAGSFTATVTDDFGGSYEIPYTVQDAVSVEVQNYNYSSDGYTASISFEPIAGETAKFYTGTGDVLTVDSNTNYNHKANGIEPGESFKMAFVEPEKWRKIDLIGFIVTLPQFGEIASIDVTGAINLEELQFEGLVPDTVDLSNNALLQKLIVTNRRNPNEYLQSIDVTNNTELTYLELNGTKVSSIDLSQNTKLVDANFNRSQLTDLDISNLSNIETLDVAVNSLTTLTGLTGKTNLVRLNAKYNGLTSVDVSDLTSVKYLDLSSNPLTDLGTAGVTNCVDLLELALSADDLSSYSPLDLSQNSLLEKLNIGSANLTGLNFGSTTYNNLIDVRIANNALSSLDLSGMPAIQTMDFDNISVNFDSIVFNSSSYSTLTDLQVYGNAETSIDLSNFTSIENLNLRNNSLTWAGINLSNNSVITEINLRNNSLTSIDTSAYGSLKTLLLGRRNRERPNNISSLYDITLNTGIETIDISDNPITSETLDFTAYPSLVNIYANDNSDDNDIDLTGIDLTGMVNLQTLQVRNNSVSSITALTDATALQTLDLRGNALSADIAFTGLTALVNIYLQANSLPSLSALNETNVKNIDISDNEIDISSEIDEQLNACETVGNENGSFDSTGGTNAAPTDTATIDNLTTSVEDGGLGWTVNTE